ncbi:hypothetical protein [Halorubrum sp. BOL3-1]|uniref:hypothetical protein n=1 Tax=Halorubrum sp. BOL3-1 TaxID=2497325 RepID=UPI0014078EA3|nr:hypothetical protein [Halorubrum sp. BOL3-1]
MAARPTGRAPSRRHTSRLPRSPAGAPAADGDLDADRDVDTDRDLDAAAAGSAGEAR